MRPETEPTPDSPSSAPVPEARLSASPLVPGVALLAAAFLAAQFLLPGSGPATSPSYPSALPEVQPALAAEMERSLVGLRARLLPTDLSTPEAREVVIRQLPVPESRAKQLVAEALTGRRLLGRIIVWDNQRQDGDVVNLSTGGFTAAVALTSQPQTIVLPYSPGSSLAIHGVRDGGGGITVAVELATGAVPLPPLKVGEVRLMPLF